MKERETKLELCRVPSSSDSYKVSSKSKSQGADIQDSHSEYEASIFLISILMSLLKRKQALRLLEIISSFA